MAKFQCTNCGHTWHHSSGCGNCRGPFGAVIEPEVKRLNDEVGQLRNTLILARTSSLSDDPKYAWLMRDIDRALTRESMRD